jgi:phosphonate transport system substrate-binding protein
METSLRGSIITVLVISLLQYSFFCRAAWGQSASPAEIKTITLGLISEVNQSAIEEHFTDFIRYVARKLSAEGTVKGKVVVAKTVIELGKLLDQRTVDFYLESPYPTYVINSVHGAGKLLLRRWKSGMAEYRSLIFTKRGGGVGRLTDLHGKNIAFEDPESTSGYFLPKFFLQRNGFKLVQKPDLQAAVTPAEVGYVFAKTQSRLVELVLAGQVSAAAFSDDDYAALAGNRKMDLEILAQTELLPRHLVSVRKDLSPALAERLGLVLLAMPDDDQGRKLMLKADNTTKFDPLPGGEEGMRRRLLETFYSPPGR